MKLNPQDLEKIADLTLEHYNRRAEDFWEGTRDHDVSQNIEALLRTIEGDPPFAILDFGCGPGRDLNLEAEATGVRATGIGCFFDDPVHQVLGFNDATFQSLYHFTTGGPVEDTRLTTLPPYGLDH